MPRRYWTIFYWIGAALFGVAGVVRLVTVGDLLPFAMLTMSLGLVLIALRENNSRLSAQLWYLPEFLIVLAVLQYGYYYLGV